MVRVVESAEKNVKLFDFLLILVQNINSLYQLLKKLSKASKCKQFVYSIVDWYFQIHAKTANIKCFKLCFSFTFRHVCVLRFTLYSKKIVRFNIFKLSPDLTLVM